MTGGPRRCSSSDVIVDSRWDVIVGAESRQFITVCFFFFFFSAQGCSFEWKHMGMKALRRSGDKWVAVVYEPTINIHSLLRFSD